MTKLQRGDVLSYSSGSTNRGPEGYRDVMSAGAPPRSAILSAIVSRWPALLEVLGGATPALFINAYPATIGRFEAGVVVDTYLSPKTTSRALQLAARESMPVVFMAQPLFAAECLQRYREAGLAWPKVMLLGVGGYPMLRSLEQTLTKWCRGCELHVLHFYGLAEIDAAMLLGRDRTPSGEVIYFPREDVRAEVTEEALKISRRLGDEGWSDPVNTGDTASKQGEGFIFPQAAGRASARCLETLESWGEDEWCRRTGYLGVDDGVTFYQLREGRAALNENELSFWGFGERFGFSWLEKPKW